MRGLKRNPWLFGLGVLLAVLVVYGGHARADVTTDQSGSIIIFPRVVADGTRDTLIQIANTDNMQTNAHCVYINTVGTCSITSVLTCDVDGDCPSGGPSPEVCVHQCTEVNFDIFLTGQQPTFWPVSSGRPNFSSAPGFSPGLIQPVPIPFVGELKCIQTDVSGAPIARNSLKGEAIITGTGPVGQLSEYNAIGIRANGGAGGVLQLVGESLCVGGSNDTNPCSTAVDCPGGTCTAVTPGYNACPAALYLNHSAEGVIDSFTGTVAHTDLTLVPCTELLEQQVPTHADASFRITTDMEESVSCTIPFDCALNIPLGKTQVPYGCNFSAAALGSATLKTRIRPASGNICYTGDARCHICSAADNDLLCLGQPLGTVVGNCDCQTDTDCPNFVFATNSGTCTPSAVTPAPACTTSQDCAAGQTCTGAVSLGCRAWPGLLGVAEEFEAPNIVDLPPQVSRQFSGTAAVNLHMEGSRPGDVIIVP